VKKFYLLSFDFDLAVAFPASDIDGVAPCLTQQQAAKKIKRRCNDSRT